MRIEKVTWLSQGHLAWPQIDSCFDDLLGDAIMRSGDCWGEGEVALDVICRGQKADCSRPVGSKVPHPRVQLSPPADYRLWQGP